MELKGGSRGIDERRISIILADDQEEVRRALRRYLDRDGRFDLLAEATDGAEAIRRVELLKPDALILDLAMPNVDGLEAIPRIREVSPQTKIVVLSSMTAFGGTGEQALALGAVAAFDKFTSPDEVFDAIVKAHERSGS